MGVFLESSDLDRGVEGVDMAAIQSQGESCWGKRMEYFFQNMRQ